MGTLIVSIVLITSLLLLINNVSHGRGGAWALQFPAEDGQVTKFCITGYEWVYWMKTHYSYDLYFYLNDNKWMGFIKNVTIVREPAAKANPIVITIMKESFSVVPIQDIFLSKSYPKPWFIQSSTDTGLRFYGINLFKGNCLWVIFNQGENHVSVQWLCGQKRPEMTRND